MENAAFASGAGMAISAAVGMRILAVEDDPIDLAILTHMLQRHGYQVTTKESPEEGLRALQDNPEGFDIVMTIVRTEGAVGIDGFELLRHAANRCPVILFSGVEPMETMNRGIFGGASAFLTKPLRDEKVRDIWRHVAQQREKAAFRAAAIADARRSSEVAVRQDDRGTKRGSAGLDDSDEGGSGGSRNQGGTAKKTKLNSPSESELYAAFVKAAEQLRGTKDYCPRGIRDLLEVQGVQLTIEQVASHLEKYRRDCLTNHQSAMPMASSSYFNILKNYSASGSSGFYMRPQGASHVGPLYNQNNGNLHANVNGNCSDQYGSGYDYQYGNGNFNDNASANGYGNGRGGIVPNRSMVSASPPSNLAQQVHHPQSYGLENGNMVSASLPSNLAQQVHQAMPQGYGLENGNMVSASLPSNVAQQVHQAMPQGYGLENGNMVSASLPSNPVQQVHQAMPQGYGLENGNMVSASLPSNPAQQVHQAMPQGYGLENGNIVSAPLPSNLAQQVHQTMPQGGNMVSASLPSNLAQPIQQAMPTNSLLTSSMGQQEFPRVSRLWYDGSSGGISMMPMPVPVDDGKELLLSYLQADNELMQSIAARGMTQGMDGDGADGQISASQPQNLITDPLSSESSNGNGTAGTSGGSGVVTDGILDREISVDEIEKFIGEVFELAGSTSNETMVTLPSMN